MVYGPTVLNAVAIAVGTHGLGNELLPILTLDGALIVSISGKLLDDLWPGRVGLLGILLLRFKVEVNVVGTLCNVLLTLTLATVLTTRRDRRVMDIVARRCLFVLLVEKLDE